MRVRFKENFDFVVDQANVLAYPAGLEDTIPKEHALAAIKAGKATEVVRESAVRSTKARREDANGDDGGNPGGENGEGAPSD